MSNAGKLVLEFCCIRKLRFRDKSEEREDYLILSRKE